MSSKITCSNLEVRYKSIINVFYKSSLSLICHVCLYQQAAVPEGVPGSSVNTRSKSKNTWNYITLQKRQRRANQLKLKTDTFKRILYINPSKNSQFPSDLTGNFICICPSDH